AAALIAAVVAFSAWSWHARAWNTGRDAGSLGYDATQYAVAARELADHARLATPFALPIELARHARPPWPLSLVQPGLLVAESALLSADRAIPARSDAVRLARR